MRSLLIAFMAIFATAQAVGMLDLARVQWHAFKTEHNKTYENQIEDEYRMKIFMKAAQKIAEHNRKYEAGEVSYKLAINKFADMDHEEFVRTMNGLKRGPSGLLGSEKSPGRAKFIAPANVELPLTVDWRLSGAVTPVKDQGHCGSCWAFSSTGALEGQHYRYTGRLISLSEQNLMDCSEVYGNNGCNGGWMDQAFAYIRDNRGIDTEESYPYEAEDGYCRYNPRTIGATATGFVDLRRGDEEQLKAAVATIGPIAIAIDASRAMFQYYSGGVHDDPYCSSYSLDHGVLVVGYGRENGKDYWLVKNSWGTSWGQNGYIKMARNKNNQCGVATGASYPLV